MLVEELQNEAEAKIARDAALVKSATAAGGTKP
jgi:hypothetical protein